MRRGNKHFPARQGLGRSARAARALPGRGGVVAIVMIAGSAMSAPASGQKGPETDCKPVYLTFDTGHMGVAALVAEVLRRADVRATFFAAQ